MKSLFTKYIWLQLILSILLLFGGALIVAFAIINKDILSDGLNIIAAVILFLFGGFAIIASFAFEPDKVLTNGIFYGSASIALGVFLCLKEIILVDYLVYLLAIFFIVTGSIELIKAIILIANKNKKVLGIIITFIIAAIFIAGGILALFFKEDVKFAFCIVAGVLVFIAGAYLLVTGIKLMVEESKNKTPEKKEHKEKRPKKGNKKQEEIKELDYTEEKEQPQVEDDSKVKAIE